MATTEDQAMSASDAAKGDALLTVMRAAGSIGERARVTAFEQLQGGWSRHSYSADVADPDRDGPLGVIVRVRPQGSLLDTDLEQEFKTFSLLVDEPLPSPGMHGFEGAQDTAYGGPFFVMDRLPGDSPNVWRRDHRADLQANWDGGRELAADLVTDLAAIHAVGTDRTAGIVTPRTFKETVGHWRSVYDEMRLVRDPVVEEAYAWVLDHEPAPVAPRLVHSDYRIGNCLVDGGRITGILDWELSHVGDPRFDLGYMALDYHAGKFAKPGSTLLNAVADRDWFDARYTELTGEPVDRAVVDVFSVVGALMLIAILSTGVRVYATGQSADIRMAWSRFPIPGLRQDVVRLMGWPHG
jgi:aminoglycoside phosphotransferase (APT) family kinase protein